MYANIRSNLGVGIHTKHVMPRFPVTLSELERLLGFTVVCAYGCQEASGSLVGLQAASINLVAQNSPEYRKPVLGLAEFGVLAPSTSNSGWSNNVAAQTSAVLPGTDSFFWLTYHSWNGTAAAADFPFGVLDQSDGAQFMRLYDSTIQHIYNFNDGTNSKTFTKIPSSVPSVPSRKGGTCRAALYDAADGLVYKHGSGSSALDAVAMGAWLGLGANVTTPWLAIGIWPGVAGSGSTSRYAIVAKGAQLNGKGPLLSGIMRSLGWQ